MGHFYLITPGHFYLVITTATSLGDEQYGYEYGDDGLTRILLPTGEDFSFTYDEFNRLESLRYPDDAIETLTYNAEGEVSSLTRPSGMLIEFEYDDMGRQVLRSAPTDSVRYLWSESGALEGIEDSTGTTQQTYDNTGRLESIQYPNGASVHYERDLLGKVTAVRLRPTPESDELITYYDYDAVGNLVRVTVPSVGEIVMVYDSVNRLIERNLPNGVTTELGYDLRGLPERIVHRDISGAVLASVVYERAPGGEPRRIAFEDGSAVLLEYDGALRVVRELHLDESSSIQADVSYAYDSVGNRTLRSSAAGDSVYTYDAGNRLVGVAGPEGTTVYKYDEDGRVVEIERAGKNSQLSYDSEDRLVTFTESQSGLALGFRYDGVGRRVAVQQNSDSRRALVAPLRGEGLPTPQLLTDDEGNVISLYIYGRDEVPLLRIGPTGQTYYLTDAIGSVIGLTDSSSTVAGRIRYDSFGNIISSSGPSGAIPAEAGGDFRFQGGWMDSESDLYYFRARYYDPQTGRFLSRDPGTADLMEPESLNEYLFALSNPHVYSDPTGTTSLLELIGSVSLSKVLRTMKVVGQQVVRTHVRDEIGSLLAEQVINALLTALNSAVPGIEGVIGLNPALRDFARAGTEFERVVRSATCGALSTVGFADRAWWEVRMALNGNPFSDGFNCSEATGAGRPRAGRPRRRAGVHPGGRTSRPDFVFKEGGPWSTDKSPPAYLVGDIKLAAATLVNAYRPGGRKRHQFNTIVNYAETARGHTYAPFALFITFFNGRVGLRRLSRSDAIALRGLQRDALRQGVVVSVSGLVGNSKAEGNSCLQDLFAIWGRTTFSHVDATTFPDSRSLSDFRRKSFVCNNGDFLV